MYNNNNNNKKSMHKTIQYTQDIYTVSRKNAPPYCDDNFVKS